MKTCFGYMRVSTAKQGEGVSLEAQREAIEAFADQQGFSIVRWFEEKETAARRGRPIFDGMIKDLLRGEADGLIVHKIDRSARNFTDWAKIGDLQDAGIDIHFATETLDFASRGGRLTADIQAVIAADYIRNLREETIKGITGRLKQGLYPFKAPIGYLDNGSGKPKTIDPIRGPLVRQAFELYASGQHSIRSLVIELHRRGLRSERGAPLARSMVENMLANPFYCGLIRIKRSGAIYDGVHEPLISVALYEDVKARKAGRTVQKRTRHRFTYRSLFRCQHCGKTVTPERQKGHVYYRCQTRDCPTKTIREEMIETNVWQLLRNTKLADIDIENLCNDMETWFEQRQNKAQALAIGNEIEAVRIKLDRLIDALIDRLIDQETFAARKEALILEQARLAEQQRKAVQDTPKPGQIRRFLELVKNLAATYLIAKQDEKREIVEITTSNRRISGKTIYMEPSEWLQDTAMAIAGLTGPLDHTTDRTRSHALERLAAIVCQTSHRGKRE